jgi:hypothetical protein
LLITDYHMRDTAFLDKINSIQLHETDVWAGYIAGEATNIWSDGDWRRVSHFPKLPIVVSRTNKNGTYCGLEAMMAIYKLGIPKHTAVVADIELLSSNIDEMVKWLDEFHAVMHFFEYDVWKYGSLDYLFDLPPVEGSWIATDSKVAEQYHHAGVHATQYLFAGEYDDSLIHRHAVHSKLAVHWGINNGM